MTADGGLIGAMVPARLNIRVDGPAARTNLLSTESRHSSRRRFFTTGRPFRWARKVRKVRKGCEAKAIVAETRAGGISGLRHAHSAGLTIKAIRHPGQS